MKTCKRRIELNQKNIDRRGRWLPIAFASAFIGWVSDANAVPSFARQTGMACSQCHTVAFGPALTPYGRQFKLNGYVWGEAQNPLPLLAAMVQGGFTHTSKATEDPPAAHFSNNDNLSVDQVSGFVAGRITKHVGIFAQVTYSGEDRHTSWDNLDIRFARTATIGETSIVYGVSVNNSPTVQDLWNSTPAWGFPYISSGLAPAPGAAPVISGTLAQTSLGATAYAMLNDHLYLEAGGYRGLSNRWLRNTGLYDDANLNMDGVAPYWRAVWQGDAPRGNYSVGIFGLDAKFRPDPSASPTDRFTDFGFDATYQYVDSSENAVSANFTHIREKQRFDASFAEGAVSAESNHLNTTTLDVTYAYRQTYVLGAGVFDTRGGFDDAVYAPNPFDGSNNGVPDSRGYSVQLEYIPFGKEGSYGRPWLNVRVGLQYVGYTKFNGGGSNYDGFGRSASDNNTLFGFFWVAL